MIFRFDVRFALVYCTVPSLPKGNYSTWKKSHQSCRTETEQTDQTKKNAREIFNVDSSVVYVCASVCVWSGSCCHHPWVAQRMSSSKHSDIRFHPIQSLDIYRSVLTHSSSVCVFVYGVWGCAIISCECVKLSLCLLEEENIKRGEKNNKFGLIK